MKVISTFALFLLIWSCRAEIDVVSYLSEYGYFDANSAVSSHKPALVDFQRTYGLETTGRLDDATKALMEKPRCGLPDNFKPERHRRRRRAMTSTYWRRTALKYLITDYPQNANLRRVHNAVRKALEKWQKVSPFKFEQADSIDNAHVTIAFSVDHDKICNKTFKDTNLAHAFWPPKGIVHFNMKYDWNNELLLNEVTLHEFGHTLGLGHSNDTSSIMYAISAPETKRHITEDEITLLRTIYSPNAKPKEPIGDTVHRKMAEEHWNRARKQQKEIEAQHGRHRHEHGSSMKPPGSQNTKHSSRARRYFRHNFD